MYGFIAITYITEQGITERNRFVKTTEQDTKECKWNEKNYWQKTVEKQISYCFRLNQSKWSYYSDVEHELNTLP